MSERKFHNLGQMNDARLKFAKRIRQKGFFIHFPIRNVEDLEYILLWRSVLDQSLCDLVRGKDNLQVARKADEKEEQKIVDESWQELIDWFNSDNYDFQTVCGFSEFNPEVVHYIMTFVIDNADTIDRKQKWNDIIRNTLQSNPNLNA